MCNLYPKSKIGYWELELHSSIPFMIPKKLNKNTFCDLVVYPFFFQSSFTAEHILFYLSAEPTDDVLVLSAIYILITLRDLTEQAL